LTLTHLGSESEHNTALKEIERLNTSDRKTEDLIPSNTNNPENFSNAQHALEIHQNLLTQCTSVSQPVILTKKSVVHFGEDEARFNEQNEVVENVGTATHHTCDATNIDNKQSSNNESSTYHTSASNSFPHPTTPIVPSK
jgi:hypothetical protein